MDRVTWCAVRHGAQLSSTLLKQQSIPTLGDRNVRNRNGPKVGQNRFVCIREQYVFRLQRHHQIVTTTALLSTSGAEICTLMSRCARGGDLECNSATALQTFRNRSRIWCSGIRIRRLQNRVNNDE